MFSAHLHKYLLLNIRELKVMASGAASSSLNYRNSLWIPPLTIGVPRGFSPCVIPQWRTSHIDVMPPCWSIEVVILYLSKTLSLTASTTLAIHSFWTSSRLMLTSLLFHDSICSFDHPLMSFQLIYIELHHPVARLFHQWQSVLSARLWWQCAMHLLPRCLHLDHWGHN